MNKYFKTKGLLVTLCIVAVSILFSSCNKDKEFDNELETGYFIAVGTVQKNGADFYFVEDDSTTIYPRNLQSISDTLVGHRVWLEFYKYKQAYKEEGYDVTAYVTNSGKYVLSKPYFKVETKEQNDSIGNDPANISTAWVTGKYLHVVFSYYGIGAKNHYINLVQNLYSPNTDNNENVYLEFRHNDRDEAYVNLFRGVASFDISDFFPAEEGATQNVVITYKPNDVTVKNFTVILQ